MIKFESPEIDPLSGNSFTPSALDYPEKDNKLPFSPVVELPPIS